MKSFAASRRRLLAAGALLAISNGAARAAPLKAGTFEPALPAPGLVLRGSDGKDVTLARFKGRAVLMFFGFTSCAEVCPVTLATLAAATRQLGPLGAQVQVLYVTVDPERDTPERLATYLRHFDPRFVGATGTPAALRDVYQRYGVVAQRVPTPGSYVVDHSTSVWIIDKAGLLRAAMPYGRTADDYVHDLKRLLAA